MKYINKSMKYFSAHPLYNSFIHSLAGIGIGVLIARPLDQGHPVQLAAVLIGLAILGHLYPMTMKKIK